MIRYNARYKKTGAMIVICKPRLKFMLDFN